MGARHTHPKTAATLGRCPDETDGKPYTMAEVYHFLLNINEFPDVYIQKARACGVRPIQG